MSMHQYGYETGDDRQTCRPLPALNGDARPESPRRRRRVGWWRAAALLFPLLVLCAVELSLRVARYAPAPTLFMPVDFETTRALYHTNRDYARPFFFRAYKGRRVAHGEPVDEHLTIPKPAGRLRVVFIGASTVEGFPHESNLAASRFLEAMLIDMLPGQSVEVINLGISALASFPLIQLARDSLTAEPDLAVVYSGQNEFYGAYGVASIQTAFTTRTGMKLHAHLRRLRVLTALRRGLTDSAMAGEPLREDLIDIMPAVVFEGGDDPRYAQATENLAGNLSEIYSIFQRAGVPVVACTLVCNERDMAPFASAPLEKRLSPDQLDTWQGAFERGRAFRRSDLAAARKALEAAAAIDSRHARLNYELAQVHLELGDLPTARRLFDAAIDEDAMPWRAGTALNRAVRTAADRNGVALADIHAGFHEAIDDQPIGWELMADHLHPSARGQALMARIIAQTIARHGLFPGLGPNTMTKLRSLDAYREQLGDDPLVELGTTMRVIDFVTHSPLGRNNRRATRQLREQTWELYDRLDETIRSMVSPYLEADEPRRARLPHHLALAAAHELVSAGRIGRAARYYHVAALSAAPYTYEQLEARTGSLVARRNLNRPLTREEINVALEDGRITLAQTRRTGGHRLMAQLAALTGNRDAAFDHVRRNWRGLGDHARRTMVEEVLGLLTRDATKKPTADEIERVYEQLRDSIDREPDDEP